MLTFGRIGQRARTAQLKQRMLAFSTVYNAAWMLRDSWHGSAARREQAARRLAEVLAAELQGTEDHEALIYAVADAMYCSPHGVPWDA